jgi:antitoxin ParD1/3/4
MTVTVTVPQELEGLVAEMVEKGFFLAPEEALIHGLYLLRDEYAIHKANTEDLRKKALVGIEQADRGELIDGELVFEKLRAKIAEAAGKTP